MNSNEMWAASNLQGEYTAWSFGTDADALAELVRKGIKTATSSLYFLYEQEQEELPQAGEYSVILDSRQQAVCIIQTTKIFVVPFCKVSAEHAYKEGESDRSLSSWRAIHRDFFINELKEVNRSFDEDMLVVCEEFTVVYGGK